MVYRTEVNAGISGTGSVLQGELGYSYSKKIRARAECRYSRNSESVDNGIGKVRYAFVQSGKYLGDAGMDFNPILQEKECRLRNK